MEFVSAGIMGKLGLHIYRVFLGLEQKVHFLIL